VFGLLDGALLDKKSYKEVMESFEVRKQSVLKFLKLSAEHLDFTLIPITDPFGPTITEPSFDAMVLSAETISGGNIINEKRVEKGWNALDLFVVGLIPSLDCTDSKMGSSFIRRWLAGLKQ
jgi:pantetheine-phosphate adenylyltransferase